MLDRLSEQTYPLDQIEVIVVADGCVDGTVEMLSNHQAPFKLHFLWQSGQGAATARNYGASQAQGDIIVFLDDDIEPTPDLVAAHMRIHKQKSGHVVIGYYPPVIQGSSLLSIEMRSWWEIMFRTMRQPGHRFTYRDLLSGNCSLSAELFAEVGGFDTAFRSCGYEDYEFGVRLIKAGAQLTFSQEAVGYHHESRDLDGLFRRKQQEGSGSVLISQRHSELCVGLPLSSFETPVSLLSGLLRKLVFARPAAGDVLAESLRYFLHFLEELRLRGPWRYVLNGLMDYWYWRGVATMLNSKKVLVDFVKSRASSPPQVLSGVKIDLREGLEAAEQYMDKHRPAGARVYYGQHYIGLISFDPSAERLAGRHLRPILATDLAKPLVRALTREGTISAPQNTDQPLVVSDQGIDSVVVICA